MSIYSTLWTLKFPRFGYDHWGCDWIEVMAQGAPAHVGTEDGDDAADPFADFLPLDVGVLGEDWPLRAVVFVTPEMCKGTERSPQEYTSPLLVLSGRSYCSIPFPVLHEQICDALRGNRPRVLGEIGQPDGSVHVVFEDGSALVVPARRAVQPFDLEAALAAVAWEQYETAYGPASNVPGQLRDLASGEPERAIAASGDLWAGLCHQHAYVSSAALPAFPILVHVLAGADAPLTIEILDILLGFATCTRRRGTIAAPEWTFELREALAREAETIAELADTDHAEIRGFAIWILEELAR